jgi:PBSX family phage portal protein
VTDVRVTAAEDDNPEDYRVTKRIVQSVRTGPSHVDKATGGDDPFSKKASELKLKTSGKNSIKPSLAKKATRLEKVYQGKTASGAPVKSKQKFEETASGYGYLEVVQPHYNLDYLAALYEASSTNSAAIRAKAANVVGLGYTLVESNKTKRKFDDLQSDEDALAKYRVKVNKIRDAVMDMLDDFNEEDDFNEVLLKAYIDYEATGQGYIEIGRGDDGQIGMIAHAPATTIRVRRERDGFVQIVSNDAVFFRNFGDTTTPNPIGNDPEPNELIVIKKYTPTNTYYGIPDIISAKEALAGNAFAAKFNLDYFENKAVPRHLIILKGAEFSPAAEQSIVEFFETGLKGKNHRSLYVPLPGDSPDEKVEFDIKPVEAGIQDQSFQKYHDSNQSEILMAHGVPPNKVGISAGVSVASALEASRTFKDQISTPEQRRWSKKITRIIKELTEAWVFKFNEMSLTDEDTQSKIDERNVRNSIEMPNEIRARKGMPAIEKGDKTVADLAEEERLAAEKVAKEQADAQVKAGEAQAKIDAQAAHAKQQAGGDGARGAERSAASSTTSAQGRNPKGEGRRS